jgi:hypothetical protein
MYAPISSSRRNARTAQRMRLCFMTESSPSYRFTDYACHMFIADEFATLCLGNSGFDIRYLPFFT